MRLTPSTPAAGWRAACLRGIELAPEGPTAVLSLSAEQQLRAPLPTQALADWQARIGGRVWVDLDAQPFRLRCEPLRGGRHG